jgi:DNA-directed RNA polymerase subunit RPC12/RpoP
MIVKCPYCNIIFTKLNLENTQVEGGTILEDQRSIKVLMTTQCHHCGKEFYAVKEARFVDNE